MKELEQKILKYGKILGNDILKVGSFLNQQVDTDLLIKMAKEVKTELTYKPGKLNQIA